MPLIPAVASLAGAPACRADPLAAKQANQREPSMDNPFVSTSWLADRLGDPAVAILDGSWHMPATGRNPGAEFVEAHIPGAVFFDIDGIADQRTALPHMLPSAAQFAAMVGALGVGDGQTIVVYDTVGLASAARVWWTFRLMGSADTRILDGGLPAWLAQARPVERGEPKPAPARFTASFDAGAVAGLNEVKMIAAHGGATIVDARSPGRFRGTEPEPRPGLRGGHIPGSVSVPVTEIVADGRLKPVAELRAIFARAGVDLGNPLVTSCGSGITAATLALALELAGAGDVAVYDGSWTEWAGLPDTPVES